MPPETRIIDLSINIEPAPGPGASETEHYI